MKSEPYLASEDSALLRDSLRGYSGKTCLEIGAGNGGGLLLLAQNFKEVAGTDIVRPSMKDWDRRSNYALADGAGCFRDSVFDLVAFNPPYLSNQKEDVAVDAGPNHEVPLKFLKDALRVVKREGRILMLLDHEAPLKKFESECKESGFVMKKVTSRRMFFEELAVFEASASGDS